MSEVVDRLAELDARYSHGAEFVWDDLLYLVRTVRALHAAVALIHANAEPLMTEDGEVYCVTEDCFAQFKDALKEARA